MEVREKIKKRKREEKNKQYMIDENLALFLEHVNFILKTRFRKNDLKSNIMKKISNVVYKTDKFKTPKIVRNEETENFEEILEKELDEAFKELDKFCDYDQVRKDID